MTVVEKINELLRALPEEKAAEVLTFAEFVLAKHEDTAENPVTTAISDDEKMRQWHQLLNSLSGAWKDDDFPTLEEIRAGEGQDIPRESW